MYIFKPKHICKIVCALAMFYGCQLQAQTNIALNKDIEASTTAEVALGAFRAVDGDSTGTRWSSNYSEPTAWLRVDLGAVYELSSTTIYWDESNAAVYEVQGSNNDTCWETLATYTGGIWGLRSETLNLSGSYRYLRIHALQKSEGDQWGYSIYEWEVYGTPSGSSSSSSSSTSSSGAGQVVFFEDFDNATLPTVMNISSSGSELVSDPAETYGGQGKSLKYTYSAMTGPQDSQIHSGTIDLSSYNTDNVYIRFVAKMPEHKHGLKFIKVFGQWDELNHYANATFGLDYTGIADGTGSMYAISFGDGTGPINDTDNTLKFNNNAANPGRSENVGCYQADGVGYNFSAADWGAGWHKFELYVKFNSGTSASTETNDGEFMVKIDDVIYMDAKCIYNRHYSNLPISKVEILGYSHGLTPAFDIWYDEIEVALNGWGNNPL